MSAGRRHESPGSEAKDFTAYGTASSVSIGMHVGCLGPEVPGAPMEVSVTTEEH